MESRKYTSFEQLKEIMTNAPLLALPDLTLNSLLKHMLVRMGLGLC